MSVPCHVGAQPSRRIAIPVPTCVSGIQHAHLYLAFNHQGASSSGSSGFSHLRTQPSRQPAMSAPTFLSSAISLIIIAAGYASLHLVLSVLGPLGAPVSAISVLRHLGAQPSQHQAIPVPTYLAFNHYCVHSSRCFVLSEIQVQTSRSFAITERCHVGALPCRRSAISPHRHPCAHLYIWHSTISALNHLGASSPRSSGFSHLGA